MRTDIDLPDKKCILEIKQTTSKIKDEHEFQLRTYLEQKKDYNFGIIINFNSKFINTVPKVECKLLVKTDDYVKLEKLKKTIRKYNTWYMEGSGYLQKTEIFNEIIIK